MAVPILPLTDVAPTTTTSTTTPPSATSDLLTDLERPLNFHGQRAYSVTAMPSELQRTVLRHQQEQRFLLQQQQVQQQQPWWQRFYDKYNYHPPPHRKPVVFGPYLLLQTLGEGEFGKVKLGIHIESDHEVAIKLIKRDHIDSSTRMTKVEREISVLRTVRHPYIVKLYDVIENDKYIGIILQCASGGELFEYILAHRYLKEKDACRLFAQLISGVHYMHEKQIVHRDLKLENLLLDRYKSILITDFGFANQFSSAKDDLMATSCGSPCYAAPELVISEGLYVGSAVDIWSCGVILYAMLCGYLPFDDDPQNPDGDNINLLYKYILNTKLAFPDYVSDAARDLLCKMLVPDPTKRCTMKDIMNHPWLHGHQALFAKSIPELEAEAMRSADLPIHMVISHHHQHRQQQLLQQQQQQQQQQEASNRRNTIASGYTPAHQQQDDQVVPEAMDVDPPAESDQEVLETPIQHISSFELPAAAMTSSASSPSPTQPAPDQQRQNDTSTNDNPPEPASDTSRNDISVPEDDVEKMVQDTCIKDPPASFNEQTPVQQKDTFEQTLPAVPDLPVPVPSPNNKRLSASTDRLLSFLSGNHPKRPTSANTPTSSSSSTSHSLITPSSTTTTSTTAALPLTPTASSQHQRRPMSLLSGEGNTGSILQAKFLSSIQRRHQQSDASSPSPSSQSPTPGTPPTPSTSLSASYVPTPSLSPSPSGQKYRPFNVTPQPGMSQPIRTNTTRRKAYSVLMNSMMDYIGHDDKRQQPPTSPRAKKPTMSFSRKTSSTPSPAPIKEQPDHAVTTQDPPASTKPIKQTQDPSSDHPSSLLPSMSEHTIALNNKHRSPGKKLIDWFKKKPISTKDRHLPLDQSLMDRFMFSHGKLNKTGYPPPRQLDFNDAKLRCIQGAVINDAITTLSPPDLMQKIKHTLTTTMGMEIKRDGSDFKLKCVRKKLSPTHSSLANQTSPAGPTPRRSRTMTNGNGHIRRILLRKSIEHPNNDDTQPADNPPVITYQGDPSVDIGDEVRFSVEVCRVSDNLPGLYIVDIRRMRGKLWSYKCIRQAILEHLKLHYDGHMTAPNINDQHQDHLLSSEDAAQMSSAHHRISMASSADESMEEQQLAPTTSTPVVTVN
ncbi:Pkinase-domain-containing protein [Hesseltinella vesiculosa]|uniref:Pkinase-domain-containing protein n=1 Tax=Hesseltinella vesiculosa TaxID=101127 RepID=A0A1X2GLL7_9FUNG|nr:Pkinase-domain-containing protein [Hesseltinella vesiculosa]